MQPEKVVIFGAGASYGSDLAQSAAVPPLGPQLFGVLVGRFPASWGALEARFASTFESDFERGMDAYIDHIEGDAPGASSIGSRRRSTEPTLNRLQADLARYFVEFFPSPQNLYQRCVAKAVKSRPGWSGAFVTLNYDLLLQLSLVRHGLRPSVYPATEPSQVEVCMPHGSCALYTGVRIVGDGVMTGVRSQGGVIGVEPTGGLLLDWPAAKTRLASGSEPPVASFFHAEKGVLLGHRIIAHLRTRFAELVAGARTIVVVGLTVREHDTHIWEPLAETSGRIAYFAGPAGQHDYVKWASDHGRLSRDLADPTFFREAMPIILREAGLG